MAGLEYLNPLFLWASAAAAVPVIIHLIFRMRTRRVIFSTLRFLKVVTAENARRLRVRDILLLILRAAAVALLALVFARPYFIGGRSEGGPLHETTDAVFVLDDSMSMAYVEDGRSRLDAARAKLAKALAQLRAGDRAGLVLASDPAAPTVGLTANFGAVESAARGAGTAPGHLKLLPAVRAAVKELAESSAASRKVVLLSDLQRTAWDGVAARQAVSGGEMDTRGIQFVTEAFERQGTNAAPVEVKALCAVWMPSQPVAFGITVASFSPGRMKDLVVKLVVGDRVVAQKSVSPEAGSQVGVMLPARLDAAGEVFGRVEVVSGDGLSCDDARHFAFSIPERASVTVVQDAFATRKHFYRDETYFLRTALDPRLSREDEPAGSFAVRAVESAKLSPGDIDTAAVVVLAGVRELTDDAAAALDRRVRSGGGLLIFLGGLGRSGAEFLPDGTELLPGTKTYSERLWRGGEGLLPARPLKPVGDASDPGRYFAVDELREGHPILSVFSEGPVSRELSRVRFWRVMALNQEDVAAQGVSVVARLDLGAPLIVEKQVGSGRVVLVATSAAADWSDFPKRKAYLPLVHQVVRYLASSGVSASRSFTVGDTLAFTPPPLPELSRVTILSPDGKELAPPVAGAPGVYSAVVELPGGGMSRRYAAVNLPSEESDLRPVKADEVVEALSTGEGAGEPPSRGDLRIGTDSSRDVKARAPYWRYILLAVLGILLLESLVANVRLRKPFSGSRP